jgi:hypothetical protein
LHLPLLLFSAVSLSFWVVVFVEALHISGYAGSHAVLVIVLPKVVDLAIVVVVWPLIAVGVHWEEALRTHTVVCLAALVIQLPGLMALRLSINCRFKFKNFCGVHHIKNVLVQY